MELDIGILDTYFEANETTISPLVYLDKQEPLLGFTRGKNANSGIRVFLSFQDIKEIFIVNKVWERIAESRRNFEQRHVAGRYVDLDKEINDAIYGTLSKYVIQMLYAATGRIIFPEIVPLFGHKNIYFQDVS